jgi:hypothetical protein
LLIFRIDNILAFIAAAWVALRKTAEVSQANLSDGPDAGVIIMGDAGCIGIMGELYCDEEVFVNRVLIEWGEKVNIHDKHITHYINPKQSNHK